MAGHVDHRAGEPTRSRYAGGGREDSGLRHQFRRLLETLPAAAYACDSEGLITYFNPRAESIWGRAPKLNDPVDRYCGSFKLFSAEGEPIAHEQCWMARALREDRPYEGCEIAIERPDGRRVPVLAYANPVRDPDGTPLGAVNVLVDISERRALEETIRERERDFTDFFEHGSLGLHWVGPDGIILRANRAELEMFGYERDEYVGHHISEFHADKAKSADILSRLATGETLHNYEAEALCKDGSIKPVALSSNVLWRDGEFVHTRCFTHDITAQKQAEAALREADARKNEFIAMLAHELRNPLEPIVTAVEYLRFKGPDDPDLHAARDVIERQVTHMTRLVDDLLSVARITRGKLEIKKQIVELSEVIERGVETARPLLEARDQKLEISLPAAALHLDADPVRLSQVVSNLLSNAAKYTAPGGHIRVVAERIDGEGGGPASVRMVVEDDGIGISPEQLPLVFDMFVQLPAASNGSRGGLGVGLTLVRSIVGMHGGAVEARSDGPGRGSAFTVCLPLVGAPAERPPQDRKPTAAPAPLRILIVDDYRDAADSLSRLLALDGHETHTAFAAGEALQAAETLRFDVILLDIGLPDADGYEVCRKIRAGGGAEVFLVAITGWGQRDDKRQAREAGFDLHLTKPVDCSELRRVLAERTPAAGD